MRKLRNVCKKWVFSACRKKPLQRTMESYITQMWLVDGAGGGGLERWLRIIVEGIFWSPMLLLEEIKGTKKKSARNSCWKKKSAGISWAQIDPIQRELTVDDVNARECVTPPLLRPFECKSITVRISNRKMRRQEHSFCGVSFACKPGLNSSASCRFLAMITNINI